MKHAVSPFAADVPKLPENATEEKFDARMEALPPCPGIGFSDDDDAATEDAEIDAEIAAQEWIPHEIVVHWVAVRRELLKVSFDEWLTERNA